MLKNVFAFLAIHFFGFTHAQLIFKYEQEIQNKSLYDEKEFNIRNNQDDITLSGSLIFPKEAFEKIIIIVPGSTRDTRHSHFILAEEFLKNNIAVFRFDERGIGKSEGVYTDSSMKLSSDLNNIFHFLTINYPQKKIGIFGHSRGGMAALEMDFIKQKPQFLILMGTPVIKHGGYVLHGIQQDIIKNPALIPNDKSTTEATAMFEEMFQIISSNMDERSIKRQTKAMLDKKDLRRKYMKFLKDFLKDPNFMEIVSKDYDETLSQLSYPCLYLVGGDDQVLNAGEEIAYVEALENKHIETILFPDSNHYLTERAAAVGTSLYKMDSIAISKIKVWISKF